MKSTSYKALVLAAVFAMASGIVAAKDNNGPIIPSTPNTAYGGSGYSAAGAIAASGSLSSAGANSHSSNYSANDIDLTGVGSSTGEKSYYLALPQPVATVIPASQERCVVSESTAFALGWNFVSGSGSKQVPNKLCYVLRMAEEAERKCQFATADFLNNVAFNEMYPSKAQLPASGRQNQIACLK